MIKILASVIVCLLISVSSWGNVGPIKFIENKGQLDSSILFYADFKGGTIYIKKDEMVFFFVDYGDQIHQHFAPKGKNKNAIQRPNEGFKGHIFRVQFLGANAEVSVEARYRGTERHNYFIGSDKSKWASNVYSYGEVQLNGIYNGIDLKLYSTSKGFKYDFIVSPGADPTQIQLQYKGLDDFRKVNETLYLKTSLSELEEQKPVSYDSDGKMVATQYNLKGNVVSFDFPQGYDHTKVLTIDPLLIFSTYSGSAADNWGNTATFDEFGNLYSGGMTNHVRGNQFMGEFPATEGAFQTEYGGIWDVAILKYDSTGSNLEYATYLGGENSEVPQSIVVNNKGELVILGITSSIDFPVLDNAYDKTFNGGTPATLFENSVQYSNGSDLFIAKLSADGSELLASTYIGGVLNDGLINTYNELVKNYGDQSRGDVIVDSEDNIYIASRTSSLDFPIVNGFQPLFGGGPTDAVIFKFNDSLSELEWSSYYGGNGEDVALSIKLTSSNEVYIAGGTNSINLPTTPLTIHPGPTGNIDGYVAKISPDGATLLASTYIGTTDYDQTYQMDLDSNGDVYVVGQTRGPFPVSSGTYTNPQSGQFVQKLSSDLSISLFSTVIGAGRDEPDIYITAFLVNDCDNLYISGWGSPLLSKDRGDFFGKDYGHTNTTGLPVTPDAIQGFTTGSDFYLAVFTDDMSELLYGTFFGSGSSFVHVDGGTSRFDKRGIVYHAVCASCSPDDSSFPTTPGAWAEENGSVGCNNAAFKFDLASLNARIRTNSVLLDNPGVKEGCPPFEIAFENISVGGQVYEWDFGDGSDTTSFVRDTIFHTFENPGTYEVVLKAIDSSTCAEEDYAYTTVNVFSTQFGVSNGITICGGTEANITASGGISYVWSPTRGLANPSSSNPVASPDTTTVYFVTIIDKKGCEFEDSVRVNVIPEIILDITVEERSRCKDTPTIEFVNNSENYESIVWEFNGQTSEDPNPVINLTEGNYDVNVTLANQHCVKELTIPLSIFKLFIPNIFTPNGDGKNDVFEITSSWPIDLLVLSRDGKEVYSSIGYKNNWAGEGLAAGVYYYEITFPDYESCSGWIEIAY